MTPCFARKPIVLPRKSGIVASIRATISSAPRQQKPAACSASARVPYVFHRFPEITKTSRIKTAAASAAISRRSRFRFLPEMRITSRSAASGSPVVRSPQTSSVTFSSSTSASRSRRETSGMPLPFSHLETVVRVICSCSASCCWDRFFASRASRISAPVFSAFILAPPFFVRPV